ncbi:MAG: hypothetical protein ABW171_12530 [Steroidobacter sp.]
MLRAMRFAMVGSLFSVLGGCAAVDIVSPGAQALTPEQSAWIISDDDVQIVSIDGSKLHSGVTIANDAFLDGVRDKVRVEPGSHEIAVRMDNGMYVMKDPTKLRVDTKAATTYHVTFEYGSPGEYKIQPYDGIPTKELLKRLDH